MNLQRTFIFIISLVVGICQKTNAQNQQDTLKDSLVLQDKYGIRVGADLSKPIKTLLDDNYTGFELIGDYRFLKNFYAAAEIGNEKYHYTEPYLDITSKGSYAKIGVNYNTYENWLNMQNEIYVGLRYGFATFSHTLHRYNIYTADNYFGVDTREVNQDFNDLSAHWAELQLGLKAELFNNLFLGVHVQIKQRVTATEPDNFDNLFIPGFNRTYGNSSFGVGWGYSLSYLIPIYKKEHEKKIPD